MTESILQKRKTVDETINDSEEEDEYESDVEEGDDNEEEEIDGEVEDEDDDENDDEIDLKEIGDDISNEITDNNIMFYVSNKGRVKRKTTSIPTYGTERRTYMRYGKKSIAVHQGVCLLFVGPPDISAKKITVDHIDGNRKNNCSENLQWATVQLQVQKSWQSNARKNKPFKQGKLVDACKVGESPEVWVRFETVQKAAAAYNIGPQRVSGICYGERKHCQGYKFRFADTGVLPILEGEEWRDAVFKSKNLIGWKVSNLGRVKNSFGIISYGYETVDDYMYVNAAGSNHPVHSLVVYTFLGEPPLTMINPSVDHIDRNSLNNSLTNLRWATKKEQANNCVFNKRGGTKFAVLARKIGDEEFKHFESLSAAARFTNLDYRVIQNFCKGKKVLFTNGFEFKTVEPIADLEGEIWKPFHVCHFNELRAIPRPTLDLELKAQKRKEYTEKQKKKQKLSQTSSTQ